MRLADFIDELLLIQAQYPGAADFEVETVDGLKIAMPVVTPGAVVLGDVGDDEEDDE